MKKIAGMVVGADHIIKNNNTFVRLWIRSDKKQAVCKVFEPYFFIEPVSVHAKKLAETISKMRVSHEKNNIILQASASKVSVESLETNSLKKEVIKVSFKTPVALTAFKVFLESEPGMRLFNCAISPARQFMLDNHINFFESFEFEVAGKFNLAGEKYPMNYFLNAGPSDKKFNEITASIYVNSDSSSNPCSHCFDKKKEKFINWVSVSCETGEKKQFYNIFNDSQRELRMIEEVKLFLDKISPDFITIFGKENGIFRLVKRAWELGGKNSFKLTDFGCDSTPVAFEVFEDTVLAGRTIIDIEQTEKISFHPTSKLSDNRFDKTGKSGFSARPPESIESVARLKLSKKLKPIQRPAPQKEEIQKRSDCLLELGRMQVPTFIFISKKTCEIPHALRSNFSKRTSKSYLEKIFTNAKQPIYLYENETGEKTEPDFKKSKHLPPNTTDCAPKGVYSDVEELSLNNALPLITLLKNTCPTTMNCNCCKPVFSTDIRRTNCAPSSEVTVVFKKDHFFFTSFDESWAAKHHESDAKNRRAREQLKKTFFLRTIPTGPFKKMEKANVLLGDAMELVKDGDADFLEFKKNHTTWFCKNKNGILPKGILNLNDENNNKREKGLAANITQKNKGIMTYCLPQPENHQISDWLKTNVLQNTPFLGKDFSHAINSFFTFFANKLKKECNTTGFTFYHIEGSSIFVDAKSSKVLKHFCSEKLGSNTLKKTIHWNKILLKGPLGVMAGITKEGLFESIQKEDIPVHANQKEVTKCFLCAGNKKRNEETLTVAKKYITKNNSTAEPQLTFFEGFELPVLTVKTRASNTAKQLEINATANSQQQI
ncbi:MAG: hypothetical protein J7K00_02005 [Candidatus Diapherotrites archaeon]|nr:hypothetical protein [Candidatus Diapherotrites archaeon]